MDITSIKLGDTFKKIATALLLTVFVVGCSSTTNKGYLKTQEVAFKELDTITQPEGAPIIIAVYDFHGHDRTKETWWAIRFNVECCNTRVLSDFN